MGGTVIFKFKRPYKLQMAIQQKTLGILRTELLCYQVCMDLSNFEALREISVFETLSKEMQDLLTKMMLTLEEAVQEIVEVEAPESAKIIVEVP